MWLYEKLRSLNELADRLEYEGDYLYFLEVQEDIHAVEQEIRKLDLEE